MAKNSGRNCEERCHATSHRVENRGVSSQGTRQGEEEGVLILNTARLSAIQLEPSNWTLSWSRDDDGSVDKARYRPTQ